MVFERRPYEGILPHIPRPPDSASSAERRCAKEILSSGQDIELDVTMISRQDDLAAWYKPPGSERTLAVRVILDCDVEPVPYGGARRGSRVRARVRNVLDNCAFAGVIADLGSFLAEYLGQRYQIRPTGQSPLDARDSISVPDVNIKNTGFRGVPVAVKTTAYEREMPATLTDVRQLEDGDFDLLGLDPERDRYYLAADVSQRYQRPLSREVYVAAWQPEWGDLASYTASYGFMDLIHPRIRGVPREEYHGILFFGDNGKQFTLGAGRDLTGLDPHGAVNIFHSEYPGENCFRLGLAEPPYMEALRQGIESNGLIAVDMPRQE